MKTRKTDKITKLQLVNELSEQTTITKVQCAFMVETLFEIIKEHLLDEQEVELKTLGRFYFFSHGERVSNMTNEAIPAHKQLKFRPAERLSRVIRVSSRND